MDEKVEYLKGLFLDLSYPILAVVDNHTMIVFCAPWKERKLCLLQISNSSWIRTFFFRKYYRGENVFGCSFQVFVVISKY